MVDNVQAFFVKHFSSDILLHISLRRKFGGALGLYNLWGLGFIKFMGLTMFVGCWAHKFFGALGLYNLWGVGLRNFLGPWAHKVCGVLGS